MVLRATESKHPAAKGLHCLAPSDILDRLLAAQRTSLASISSALPMIAQAATAAAGALQGGGKMAYAGAGSAGLMALSDGLELAGTFGLSPKQTPILFAGGAAALLHMTGNVEDDPALALADVAQVGLGAGDVVICVSASGSTPYTISVAQQAKEQGARIIGIANTPDAPLLHLADIAILLESGPELIAGSTRMAAATAQKVALNMLSALVGVRLGHVHDGLMVNLVADNAKLVERAARIVSDIAGCSIEQAKPALAKSAGAVKPAVLIAQGADVAQATEMLRQSAGHLGPLLK